MTDYYSRRNSYVYTYAYPKDYPDCQKAGKVFYVGQGQGNRIDDHLKEAKKGIQSPKCDTIREIWAVGYEPTREKVQEHLTVYEAEGVETRLIREHKHTGFLTNGIGPKFCKHDKPKVSVVVPSIKGDLAKRFRCYASIEAGHKLSEEDLSELADELMCQAIEEYCKSIEQEQGAISGAM